MTEAIVTGGQWEAANGAYLNGVGKVELRIIRPDEDKPDRVAEVTVTNFEGAVQVVFRLPIDPTDTIDLGGDKPGYYSASWFEQ